MKISNIQTEWDYSAYMRKFHATCAYVQVGDAAPTWRWIGAITDNYFVYDDARKKPIGQIVCQKDQNEVQHDKDEYPIVQFFYQSFVPGPYWAKADGVMYYLAKRHIKSYKIGLSDETHSVLQAFFGGDYVYGRVSRDIDLSRPVMGRVSCGNAEVFDRRLVRLGTSLMADGNIIGFMEGGKCVVKHSGFVPLIKSVLGDKWQIES